MGVDPEYKQKKTIKLSTRDQKEEGGTREEAQRGGREKEKRRSRWRQRGRRGERPPRSHIHRLQTAQAKRFPSAVRVLPGGQMWPRHVRNCVYEHLEEKWARCGS